MTKKHFITLAKAINARKNDMPRTAFDLLVRDVVAICIAANDNFDVRRFVNTCEG